MPSAYYWKRCLIGLVVFLATGLVLGSVPGAFDYTRGDDQFFFFRFLPSLESALKLALAAVAGAYAARVAFVVPTIVCLIAVTIWSWHLLVRVASVVQPTTLLEVGARNAPGTALTIVLAVAGAELGRRLSASSKGKTIAH